MRRIILTVLGAIALPIALLSCASSNTAYEEELKKDEYLKSSFPTKKQGKNANTPVGTTFDR